MGIQVPTRRREDLTEIPDDHYSLCFLSFIADDELAIDFIMQRVDNSTYTVPEAMVDSNSMERLHIVCRINNIPNVLGFNIMNIYRVNKNGNVERLATMQTRYPELAGYQRPALVQSSATMQAVGVYNDKTLGISVPVASLTCNDGLLYNCSLVYYQDIGGRPATKTSMAVRNLTVSVQPKDVDLKAFNQSASFPMEIQSDIGTATNMAHFMIGQVVKLTCKANLGTRSNGLISWKKSNIVAGSEMANYIPNTNEREDGQVVANGCLFEKTDSIMYNMTDQDAIRTSNNPLQFQCYISVPGSSVALPETTMKNFYIKVHNVNEPTTGGFATAGDVTRLVNQTLLQSASNIIGIIIEKENNGTWLTLKQENGKTTETLLSLIDKFGSAVRQRIGDNNLDPMLVVTKNIAFEVRKIIKGIVLFPDNSVRNYTKNDSKWILHSKNRIFLNTSALGVVVATTVIYKNLTDLMYARSEFNSSSNDGVIVNGPVLSCSISNESHILTLPIILTFEHGQANYFNPSCNYWKFSRPGYWASDGCSVRARDSDDSITVCECNHLTNFAVLMSPLVEADVTSKALRLVSIVGISVSTFCLLLTIIVFAKLWRYVQSDRSVMLLNLIVALVVSYAIFIGGIDRTENKIVCMVAAAALHYIYSAVFCLMLAEGIGIAIDVILVFAKYAPLRQLLVFAWGLPVIIVGTTLAITQTNGFGNEHYCWLSLSRGLRWAFVGPALFVILFNVIVLSMLFKKMFALKAMVDKPIKDKVKKTLWSLCVLVPLMGVSWILGIFYVNESASFMQYVFAICNGLQGVYIFVFNCILNRQVRNGFKMESIRRRNKSMTRLFSLNLHNVSK
ncbi:adhesion G protein-coupled receptor L3-like [Dreissena polymorpha]|uniref:adhesion G protein-coupled receptor L3-like n=1 Tax=Dreissena polymorpha TaxID=45954 RepID=UPI0022653AA6|nr:adhesion G protein-coupled receptor L3-like [Dreissena polymorpha]